MHLHILGICGTFMGSLAIIARQLGHDVSGSDENVYPPMSTQLEQLGITLRSGYTAANLEPKPDLVVVGNVISRGNLAMEYILNERIPFISGPQWLYENVLQKRWVLAIAGTHGKTTTTAMVAWILQFAGKNPGFLIGGVPKNFTCSADLGQTPYFVIEADEYDTAYFDKRSKFLHYHPRTVILNNLEFDHGDIFPDLAAIKKQFAYLLRAVPGNGLVISPEDEPNLADVFVQGYWSERQNFGTANAMWQAINVDRSCQEFTVTQNNKNVGTVKWQLLGQHNVRNALAAIATANHIGIAPQTSCEALCEFAGVKRRLEKCGDVNGVTVYDDFAHHPTAIATTLQGLRHKVGNARIIAVVEFASNTMRAGMHGADAINALATADLAIILRPQGDWIDEACKNAPMPFKLCNNIDEILATIKANAKKGDNVLVMSNKGFGGIQKKILKVL